MGSFNTTCAITRTPIQEDGLARVFFLEMDVFKSHWAARNGLVDNIMTGCGCYPWDNFKIIGLPLLGKYADYNQYEFQDETTAQITLDAIRECYVPNKIAEGKTMDDYNEYHDYMEIDEIDDMHQLQDMEHSSALRVKGASGHVTNVVKMAIHEEVYQLMLQGAMSEGWGKNRKTYTFDEDVIACMEKYANGGISPERRKRLEEFRDALYTKVDNGEINEQTGNPFTREEVEEIFNEVIELESTTAFLDEDRAEWFVNSAEIRRLFSKQSSDNACKLIAEAYVGAKWCARWMQANNYEFGPAITSGQDYDTSSHAERLRELADIIESKKSRWHYEETIEVKTVRVNRFELSVAEIKRRFDEWFAPTDDEYIRMLSVAEASIGIVYAVGDGSDFDKIATELSILPDEFNEGDEIHVVK